jgi:hypothetical protein
MNRVEVDLNVRGPAGRTRVALRRFNGTISLGEQVLVFEPDENVETIATIAEISADGRFAFLDVDWNSLHEAVGLLATMTRTYSVPVPAPSPVRDFWSLAPRDALPQIAFGV